MDESGQTVPMGSVHVLRDFDSSKDVEIRKHFTNDAFERNPEVKITINVAKEHVAKNDDKKYTFPDFMQATTFHGVRYIFDASYHRIRRIIWTFCVVIAILTFIYQVTSRGITYFGYDTTMGSEIQYVKQLELPTVTICNHNSYRITKVYAMGMFNFVTHAYGIDPEPFGEDNVTSKDLRTFMNEAAHQKTDLIQSCLWNGQPCDIERDFHRMFTDYGVCYTFNHHRFTNKTYVARKTGPKYGLRLTLNAETYEYMSGPFQAAGIQVLVHDKMELPLLQSQGFSVRPGVHARVSVQKTEFKNLEPPHGSCKQNASPRSFCLGLCEAKQYVDRCHCNDPYTADITPKNSSEHLVPDCSTYEALTCVHTEEELSPTDSECLCEQPCEESSYGTMLSYAQLSNMVHSTTDEKKKYFHQAHVDARNTIARVTPTIAEFDTTNILGMYQATTGLTGLFRQYEDEFNNGSNLPKTNITGDPGNACTDIFDFTSQYLADINLIESEYDRRVELAVSSDPSDMSDFTIAMESLEKLFLQEKRGGREKLVECAEMQTDVNFTSHNYEKECDLLTETLLESMISQANYPNDDSNEFLYPALSRYSKTLPTLVTVYTQLISEVFFDSENDNPSHLSCIEILVKYKDEWMPRVEETLQKLVLFYDTWSFKEKREIYDYLYNVSESVNNVTNPESPLYLGRFDVCQWYKKLIEQNAAYTEMKISGNMITDILTNRDTENELLETLTSINLKGESSWRVQASHLEEFLTEKITKTDLANVLESDEWGSYISDMREESDAVTNYYKKLQDVTIGLKTAFQLYYTHVADLSISFSGNQDFMNNLTLLMTLKGSCRDEFNQSMLASVTTVGLKEIAEHFLDKTTSELKRKYENVHNGKVRIIDTNLFLQFPFQNFLDEHSIQDSFFTTNFIKLDIFYKDFTYTLVSQKVDLEFISYLSEIGGFLGLLLGASFLTVCELIDYICLTLTRKQRRDDK